MARIRRCSSPALNICPPGNRNTSSPARSKDAPIEVYPGPLTGLPIPAHAEIVFEGHLLPMSETTLPEGPFGEFTGYYASEARPAPVMEVTASYHRDDPILLGSPPMKPPRFHFGLPFRAATIWQNLDAAGVTDVVGAWQHVSQLMTVVALKQRYDGHAKRAALVAAAHSYMARIVVVVDEDVDPSNLNDVMWAVATRCEPSEQIDIVRNAWSSALDPRISAADKQRGVTSHSKVDHRGVPAVSLARQVSADVGAVARGGAGDRGEVGRCVEVKRRLGAVRTLVSRPSARPLASAGHVDARKREPGPRATRRCTRTVWRKANDWSCGPWVPGLALLARDTSPRQFPNGFSFSSRACASFATLRSNSCSRGTFFSTKLKYLPLQKSCISMIESTSGRPSSAM